MSRAGIIALFLVFLVLTGVSAQTPTRPPAPPRDPQFEGRRNGDAIEERMERERQKRLNTARHDKLKEETEELLKLAEELKKYVAESNENLLSLNVVRKAEEIEKLAKKVKDGMKGR